ncbi:MAG: ParB/RepB/Spo0J family partition protein [Gemmatimonadetes bacterium]|uniref:ParB/RepB/Spo0J family partition protein n=1 Tax=Candidatus Kutchimonas denitrificans TaxID=3056748 RepID=A0AAE4Z695_9BACT|nr:ParB/RepB/Spo0J family partition protein [Gemmatimonadota bacterium]NIR74119.1 ParB/RepB/Spo0J family partition protein [Candidatus Kutchimonas denitrificans]NIS01301.1 ParB/RepB/Spo0J family partition protein [Gemmatimonadota bacterium]NIT67032.1 ParB/RepB/Spo0J family partition protein [Gemmatimonadota bacterium]NIU51692.1 ParB/RepB/Spo0J family partition protein [Gemmatimonadota bacterium]
MVKKQQKRLGKGLSALLGDYLPEEGAAAETERLPVAELRPNPFQPRQAMDREGLEELVASIKENGLLQPLVVRQADGGGWEVVAGERRFRAVQELGWSHVPVVRRDVDDRTMLVLALIENLQREDLSPLDEAHAYRRLVDEFGLTQTQVAERVGRDRSTVANTIRLLGLPEPVRELLADGRISAGHARALLGLEDEKRVMQLAKSAAEKGLSVRQVEDRVRQGRTPKKSQPKKKKTERRSAAFVTRAEQALSRSLGTGVRIRLDSAERGRIEIPFRDTDDFERIVEAIVGVGGVI